MIPRRISIWLLLLCLCFLALSFFLPIIKLGSKRDSVLGYQATQGSWEQLFNYEQQFEDWNSRRFAVIVFMMGENNRDASFSADTTLFLGDIYDWCLRLAWICNALPILILAGLLVRKSSLRWALLIVGWVLAILAWSFVILSLLASKSFPIYLAGYWMWAGSLLLLILLATLTRQPRTVSVTSAAV